MKRLARTACIIMTAAFLACGFSTAFGATLLMMVVYVCLLAAQRQKARVVGFASVAAAILVVGFTLSVALGGQSVADRFSSLFQEDPTSLYYESRGIQVRYAVTDMAAQYPVGAGLGRWGMLSYYFGDRHTGLFAEVQTAAWVLDGGMPLVLLYSLTLIATLVGDWKLIRSLADPEDKRCATIVVAANIGTVGLIATFIPFGTAVGMQFWFLEGLLRGAMVDRPRIGQ